MGKEELLLSSCPPKVRGEVGNCPLALSSHDATAYTYFSVGVYAESSLQIDLVHV